MQTVDYTVEYESTVNQSTEEIEDADTETPDTEGEDTYPVQIVQDSTGVDADSSLRKIEVYTIRVGETEEGKEQIEITTDSTVTVYRAPVGGEVITIFQDTTSNELQAVITGDPGEEVITLDVDVKTGFWFGFARVLMWLFLTVIALAFGYGMYEFIQAQKRGMVFKGMGQVGGHLMETLITKFRK